MKKLINSPDTVVTDALAGVAAAHPSLAVDIEKAALGRRDRLDQPRGGVGEAGQPADESKQAERDPHGGHGLPFHEEAPRRTRTRARSSRRNSSAPSSIGLSRRSMRSSA